MDKPEVALQILLKLMDKFSISGQSFETAAKNLAETYNIILGTMKNPVEAAKSVRQSPEQDS